MGTALTAGNDGKRIALQRDYPHLAMRPPDMGHPLWHFGQMWARCYFGVVAGGVAGAVAGAGVEAGFVSRTKSSTICLS